MKSQIWNKNKSVLSSYYRFEFEKDLKETFDSIHLSNCLSYDQNEICLNGNQLLSSVLTKLYVKGLKTSNKETCFLTYAGHIAIVIVYPGMLVEIFTSLNNEKRWLIIQDRYYQNKLENEMNTLRMALKPQAYSAIN